MADKKLKIINYVNVIISVVALILECMPKSVKMGQILGDGVTIKYTYWSYFGSPFDPIFFMTWVIVICTVVTLLLNIISLFKDKRGICITSLVLQSIAAAMGVLLFHTVYSAFVFIICAYQVIIMNLKLRISYTDKCSQRLSSKFFLTIFSFIALVGSIGILYVANAFGVLNAIIAVMTVILFLIQFIIHCIVLKGDKRSANKKIATINWLNLITMTVAVFLETASKSIKEWRVEWWFGEETITMYDTSYFAGTGDLSVIITSLIVAATICVLVLDIVTMIIDLKPICITVLALGILAAGCNLAVIIWFRRFVTAYMIIIMILFLINIITLSIKLKMNAWNKKINTERAENASI